MALPSVTRPLPATVQTALPSARRRERRGPIRSRWAPARISVGGGNGSNGPATRRIINVAAGRIVESGTDAVNGGQLYSTNQRVGAVETRVNDIDDRIGDVESVTANIVSYDDGERSKVTLAGIQGTTLDNVAAGNIALDSMQAINGGQLYQSLSSIAGILGGGAALGMQGLFVAPSYMVQGANYSNVGDALAALDTQITTIHANKGNPTGGGSGGVVGENGSGGVVLGDKAKAPDVAGPGIGPRAHAAGLNDTALGSHSRVEADGSTAVGANSAVSVSAVNAVAVGEGASVNAVAGTAIGQGAVVSAGAGTAIGQGASVRAEGAVAIGQGSVADRANTVSMGSAGNDRQITHVAEGTQAADAVNKAQLDRSAASANAYTDGKFGAMADSFEVLRSDMGRRLQNIDERIDRQGAMSAAMLNMATSAAGVRTENRVGVGVGFQGGESALSVGYQRAFGDRATVTLGGAFSSDDSSVGIGAGFGW